MCLALLLVGSPSVADRHSCKEHTASWLVAGALPSRAAEQAASVAHCSGASWNPKPSTLKSGAQKQHACQPANPTCTGSMIGSRCRQQAHLEQAVVEDGRLPALLGVLGRVCQAPQVSAACVALQAPQINPWVNHVPIRTGSWTLEGPRLPLHAGERVSEWERSQDVQSALEAVHRGVRPGPRRMPWQAAWHDKPRSNSKMRSSQQQRPLHGCTLHGTSFHWRCLGHGDGASFIQFIHSFIHSFIHEEHG